jgi:hypothetical protein
MGEENRKGAPEEPGAFQKVLGSLNQGQKIRALEIARKHGIPDDDPVWHVVLTIAEAEEGIKEIARSLREASVAVTSATYAEVKASRELAAREIVKMQEAAKANIANALGATLENEIRNAVGRLQSQSNRPLHKKWLIAMGVVVVIATGGGAWGWSEIKLYYENLGIEVQKDADKAILEKWDRWSGVTSCQGTHLEMRTKNGLRLCLSGEATGPGWMTKN